MTTLYRPVLIESAEQAEGLPEGVIAVSTWGMWTDARTHTRTGWMTRSGSVLPSDAVVDWTALVPIEAEEETVERHRLCREVPDVLHRFTTPWTLYTAKETP